MAVTRGRIRGGGGQLASYLLRSGENDSIRVLDIVGTSQPHDLRKSLLEMSLTSELSKRTTKGLYQVVINPAPEESYCMSDADWIRAAEILEQHTGFSGQPRAMILHEKNGRIHCHCVWQRWSFEKNRIIQNRFSRLKQNDARLQIEQELDLVRTQKRNLKVTERRELLTALWQQHDSGKGFIKAIEQHGYTIAWSNESHPLRLVSPEGVDSDLVRDISGVRKRQVTERLKDIDLPNKKQAIKRIRQMQKSRHKENVRDKKRIENLKLNFMNWEETFDTCAKEYAQHLNDLKQSLETLNADKAMILGGKYTEENAPDNIKEKVDRDKKSWQKDWGIYGSRIQEMTQKHQKQVYTLMRKQEIVNELNGANEQGKEKSKQNGRGR